MDNPHVSGFVSNCVEKLKLIHVAINNGMRVIRKSILLALKGKGDKMESYRKLFEIFLSLCQEDYNPEKPYDNLEKCCSDCNRYSMKLLGMLELLEEMGQINEKQYEDELKKVFTNFSTHKLFNAYSENGEVYVWTEKAEVTYPPM